MKFVLIDPPEAGPDEIAEASSHRASKVWKEKEIEFLRSNEDWQQQKIKNR